jgi:NADPH-dependent 2,4-dienoyl-CoA reductase/sulfur reductase-like enzyme
MSAASQARRRTPEAEVVVFERGATISYGACGMPYNIGAPERSLDDLVVLTPEQARDERGIDLRLGHEVTALELEERQIVFRPPGATDDSRLAYDSLILATGARARRLTVAGCDLDGVVHLRTIDDGRRIKDLLASGLGSAVIIGAGYVGMEMAHVLRQRGLAVTLLEREPQILSGWHRESVTRIAEVLKKNGVEIRTGVTVRELEGGQSGAVAAVATDQDRHPAELVLVAVGIEPNVELAAAAGLALGESGAIRVNHYQQTSDPAVWAAGDCAEAYHRILRKNCWAPLGTTANKQGRVAAANALGAKLRFRGIVGTAGFTVFDLEAARAGLSLEQARDEGFEPVAVTIRQRSRGHAYPGGSMVRVTLFADRPSGILLGGEIVGNEGAALRVNTLAAALASHLAVTDLQGLDLVYAPPFAPTWDPLLVAANQLSKSIGRER